MSIKTAFDAFATDCGRYPTTAEGFTALLNCPANISTARWHGPYLEPAKIPLDSWGNEYVYRFPGLHDTSGFDLYSCGSDQASKSGGNDPDDINNWNPNSPRGYFSDRLGTFASAAIFPLFVVALSLIVGLSVTAVFSRRVRNLMARHPIAHNICVWILLAGLLVLLLSCLIPQIS